MIMVLLKTYENVFCQNTNLAFSCYLKMEPQNEQIYYYL